MLRENMELLRIDRAFTSRYLNEGFSGGEKKRAEILQLAMLKPEIAVLDETDSGLDIDALRIVSDGVNALRGPEMGTLIITHYTRILDYVKPEFVHIMLDGRIVREGGPELADELEEQGLRVHPRGGRGRQCRLALAWLEDAPHGRARGLRGRAGADLAPLGLLDHLAAQARPRRARAAPLRAGRLERAARASCRRARRRRARRR